MAEDVDTETTGGVPIPRTVGIWLRLGVLSLVVTAAVGNIGHTFTHVDRSGQHGWYAAAMSVIPDVGVLIGVTLLTYRRRSFWGWAIVLASAAFVSWSAVAVASSAWGDRVVALAPVGFAAIAAGLLESIRGESLEVFTARLRAETDAARLAARTAREEAEKTVRDALADAARMVAEASEDAARKTVRITELEALMEALRAPVESVSDAARKTSGRRERTRPATARKAPVQQAPTRNDVQRYRDARDAYKASVRAGEPWLNPRLACALAGCADACADGEHRPDPDALKTARKRASDWRAEVAREDQTEAAQ